MSFKAFTALEDVMVQRYFPRYGGDWAGWAEVLKGRSQEQISHRYWELQREEQEKADEERRKAESLASHKSKADYVMACMHAGLAPSQIDRRMNAPTGTAHRIVLARWASEGETKGWWE